MINIMKKYPIKELIHIYQQYKSIEYNMIPIKNKTIYKDLQKLQTSKEIVPINPSFIYSYFISVLNISPMDQQIVKKIFEKTKYIYNSFQDGLLTQTNVYEIMAFCKFRLAQAKKDQPNFLNAMLDQVHNQMVCDTSYVMNMYMGLNENIEIKKIMQRENFEQMIDKSKIQKIPSSMGECQICLQPIHHMNISPLSCGHTFHKTCFQEYVKGKVQSKGFPILCPDAQCKKTVETRDIEQDLDKATLQKFYEFTFHTYVEKNGKNTSWCPTPGCTSVFSFENDLTEYKCPACKKHYCLLCRVQMHKNLTCQEYRQINNLSNEDKQFLLFAKGAKFKQCPQCRFWVSKNHGCDHMTCRCGYQFCYRCGAKYGSCSCDQNDSFYGSEEDVQEDIQIYQSQLKLQGMRQRLSQ